MEAKIRALKAEKNAVVMAHNYQPLDIQALADVVGDSLELAVKAKETGADRSSSAASGLWPRRQRS